MSDTTIRVSTETLALASALAARFNVPQKYILEQSIAEYYDRNIKAAQITVHAAEIREARLKSITLPPEKPVEHPDTGPYKRGPKKKDTKP